MDRETHDAFLAKLIVRAWQDSDFKEKLLNEPKAAMEEIGIPLEEKDGEEVVPVFLENTKEKRYFVLPDRPQNATLDDVDVVALMDVTQLVLPVCDRS